MQLVVVVIVLLNILAGKSKICWCLVVWHMSLIWYETYSEPLIVGSCGTYLEDVRNSEFAMA